MGEEGTITTTLSGGYVKHGIYLHKLMFQGIMQNKILSTNYVQQKTWPMWARVVTVRRYWGECISFITDNTSNTIIIWWYVFLDGYVSRNGTLNVKYGSFSTNRKLKWLLASTWWISTILLFFKQTQLRSKFVLLSYANAKPA